MRRQANQSPAAQAKELSSEEEEEEEDSEQENSSQATSSEEENGSEEEDNDDDEDEAAREKQSRVESDLRNLRRMLEDMDKMKLRLQFRLNSEREAKLAEELRERELLEAQQQREQEMLERQRQEREIEVAEAQRQQQEREAIELERKHKQDAQRQLKQAQSILPEETPAPRCSTVAAQTDYDMAFMERLEYALIAEEEHKAVMQDARVEQTESPRKASASVQRPVRLSLYDLVKSPGLKQTLKRPSVPLSPPHATTPNAQAQDEIATPPPPLDESESSTFFIRRQSERNAAWKDDSFAGVESLPQGKDSIITSPSVTNVQDQEDEDEALFESFQSNRPSRAHTRQPFRSSIDSRRAGTTTAAPSPHGISQRRSPFDWSPAELDREDDDAADKTEAQREMAAIRALLF